MLFRSSREVQPHRQTKSIGAENTFEYDLITLAEMNVELDKIAEILHERIRRKGLMGRTITLKIKYSDFKLVTRSHSFLEAVTDLETIVLTAKKLLADTEPENQEIRLLGISISNFGNQEVRRKDDRDADQLALF